MGLFSNLKNFVTGGGAEVSLEVINQAKRGSPVTLRVTAIIGPADIEIEHVSVKIMGKESVKVPNVNVAKTVNEIVQSEKKTVEHSENTFQMKDELASDMTLKASQTYTWEAKIDVPEDALPTFIGKNAKHKWQAMASLVMRGNDPDTGWLDFEVS
ncbi:MAG: hypothetical protein ABJN69_12710 [Hellea sp.]